MDKILKQYIDIIQEDLDDDIKSKFIKGKNSFLLFHAIQLLSFKKEAEQLLEYSKTSGLPDFEKCLSYITENEVRSLSKNLLQPFITRLKNKDNSLNLEAFMTDTSKMLLDMIYSKISADYKISDDFKSKLDKLIPHAIMLGEKYIKHCIK